MKRIRSIVAVLALAVLAVPHAASAPFDSPESSLLAQGRPFDSPESSLLAQGRLSQLRGIQELRSWFNTFKDRPRLILLLSPT